jgi:G3E family GTPase
MNPDPERNPAASRPPPPRPARYIMVGGFLGAGKTTAVLQLARRLKEQGHRLGLITNDQGSELVDTAMLSSHGFAVEEIAGGCFCCRFNSLVEAARSLSEQAERPEIFIAEPVGSCTDLVATVSYPLRRIYGDDFSIAPLSVLVDPVRAARMLGLAEGPTFSEKVRYIYLKQLEEAEVIVINKCDLLEEGPRTALRAALAGRFPEAMLVEISARHGDGLAPWLEHIAGESGTRSVMDVDYDVYAEGEALLGWLNATLALSAETPFDGNEYLRDLAAQLQRALVEADAEVAHLKLTLEPAEGLGELAVVNLVRNDFVPELSQEIEEPLERGQIIVNVRAEAPSEVLRDALERAIAMLAGTRPQVRACLEHHEHFQPGRPQPTHRMEN